MGLGRFSIKRHTRSPTVLPDPKVIIIEFIH